MSRSKAQFLNQFNQIKPNIVKIKVNSIAQFFLCTHCCLFFWLKKTQYILSSASLDVWKPKPKKSEKKVLSNNMKHSVYLLLYINYETRILRHDSSSRLHHAASAFFYFFSFVLSSVNSPYTMCCAHSAHKGQFCFFWDTLYVLSQSQDQQTAAVVCNIRSVFGDVTISFSLVSPRQSFGKSKGSCRYT